MNESCITLPKPRRALRTGCQTRAKIRHEVSRTESRDIQNIHEPDIDLREKTAPTILIKLRYFEIIWSTLGIVWTHIVIYNGNCFVVYVTDY